MTEHFKPGSTLRIMNLVYLAQVAIMMIFGLVALYVRNIGSVDNELAKMLQYVLIGLLIGGLIGAQVIPGILINRIDKKLNLKNKISKYFPAVLVRSAFLETPGLFAGVSTILTGRSYFIVIVVLLLVALYFYRPSRERIAKDLNLNAAERMQLDEMTI